MVRVVGSSRLVGRSRQKIKFAGGVYQILVNKPTILPFLVEWGLSPSRMSVSIGYFIRPVQPEDVVSCITQKRVYT